MLGLTVRKSCETLANRSLKHANARVGCILSNSIDVSFIDQQQSRGLHSPAYKRHLRKKQKQKNGSIIPTSTIASSMPLRYAEMDNGSLITLGALGKTEARAEILKRHIMAVDNVSYNDACVEFAKIEKSNLKHMALMAIPYQIGIGTGMTAAAISFPLVFHYDSVAWFNEAYVTADVPEPKDLETWLEIGSWSWNWMEPVMGQVSFVLLCLQYARAQIHNLGSKPYTSRIKEWRAQRIANEFLRFDSRIVMDYSKSVNVYVSNGKKMKFN